MKSRTLFFDKTVLKKDLTRFFPLWTLYLMVGLLIMHVLSGFYGSYFDNRGYSIARDLNAMTGPLGILSACYGFLAAQLLFGDLHNTRLCYGIHALPLRREGWYLTHTVSGLLMGLVPPLVIVLTLMPLMGEFWFTALLCWGGMALHYLFFFGLSALCMMCTGHRFAATAVFGILNFLALIINWFAKTIYIPLLPGVRANTGIFDLFCPVVELVSRDDYFRVQHLDTCPCYDVTDKGGYLVETWYDGIAHDYGFMGLGDSWGYLWVLAGVGIVLLVMGLVLYRRRDLERAGDFMAFSPMKPIFLTVYTLCVGGVMFYLAEEMVDTFAGYIFFVIGIFLGYFTGKMLLERTIRVFKGRSWAGLGILYAAVALSLLLTWADPIGIARRIPDSEKVETVYVADGHLSDYQLNNLDGINRYSNVITVTDPEDIAKICEIHGMMLTEHKLSTNDYGHSITLQYQLKNGTKISRTYSVLALGEARKQLTAILTKPQYVFGCDTLEQLQDKILYLDLGTLGPIPTQLLDSALEALWKDAEKGYVHLNPEDVIQPIFSLELEVSGGSYRRLYYYEYAPNLAAFTKAYSSAPELLLKHGTAEQLIKYTKWVYFPELHLELAVEQYHHFLTRLWTDCEAGKLHTSVRSNTIQLELDSGLGYQVLYIDKDSQSAQWLNALNAQFGYEP